MTNLLLNRRTAVAALVSTAMLSGGVAFAYLPTAKLTVSGTAALNGGTATITNANPSCATRIDVDDTSVGTIPAGTTTASLNFSVVRLAPGRHSVRAQTTDCIKGQKEHAKNAFVILDAKVVGAPTAKVKKNYTVQISGLFPGVDSTTTATLSGTPDTADTPGTPGTPGPPVVAMTQVRDTDTAGRRGDATTKFKFPKPGLWSVVVTASVGASPITTYTVTVTP
jgi:hypothetical protein